jgi:Mrp family chromosome partitioning ATPase
MAEARSISMSCPSAKAPKAAPAIAYLSEFGELIADLADGYDDVIIALPPLLDTPEARTLSAQADGVVLVVAWGRTPRQLVHAYLDQDPGLHARGAGVVLSRVNLRRLAATA